MSSKAQESDKDCDWMVATCKSRLQEKDVSGAKAWILTARSLFPNNFKVQFESVFLHLSCGESNEAIKTIVDLWNSFPKEPKLVSFLSSLMTVATMDEEEATKVTTNDTVTASNRRDLFYSLPKDVQKSIILTTAGGTKDSALCCKAWLLLMKVQPDMIPSFDLECFTLLCQHVLQAGPLSADGEYKRLLVCDVIPLLVDSSIVGVGKPIFGRNREPIVVVATGHFYNWLEVAANYYTSQIALTSMKNQCYSPADVHCWEKLNDLLYLVARKCGWLDIIQGKLVGPQNSVRARWAFLEKLSGYSRDACKVFEPAVTVAIGCFYIAILLFFQSLWEYHAMMSGLGITDAKQKQFLAHPWVLSEETMPSTGSDERAVKRSHIEQTAPEVNLNFNTGSSKVNQAIQDNFAAALNCWNFLHSNMTYNKELNRLCQQWGTAEWSWFTCFTADVAAYKGSILMAKNILSQEWERLKSHKDLEVDRRRCLLQLTSYSASLQDSNSLCRYAAQLMSLLPDDDLTSSHVITTNSKSFTSRDAHWTRSMTLQSCKPSIAFPFCITAVLNYMKERLTSKDPTDKMLGQLLVLLQYRWPEHEQTFWQVVEVIKQQKVFCYQEFFKYVINIDILEEFMYLANSGIFQQLDILPAGTIANTSRSRTVTRSVNKGVKGDLPSAMEKQVTRCDEPVEPLLKLFFKTEHLDIS
ncbi:integrator complex subunit 10-like [Dysidea avara]|uniref:integrator complex subunit 10-like n=1 Tax=Dysidea avara TaxID=196820 RepID=UPI00331E6C1A